MRGFFAIMLSTLSAMDAEGLDGTKGGAFADRPLLPAMSIEIMKPKPITTVKIVNIVRSGETSVSA